MHQNANNDNKNVHIIVDYPIHETQHHIYSEHKQTPITCGDVYCLSDALFSSHSYIFLHCITNLRYLSCVYFKQSLFHEKCLFKHLIKIKHYCFFPIHTAEVTW